MSVSIEKITPIIIRVGDFSDDSVFNIGAISIGVISFDILQMNSLRSLQLEVLHDSLLNWIIPQVFGSWVKLNPLIQFE